jgi:hypothetical protein
VQVVEGKEIKENRKKRINKQAKEKRKKTKYTKGGKHSQHFLSRVENKNNRKGKRGYKTSFLSPWHGPVGSICTQKTSEERRNITLFFASKLKNNSHYLGLPTSLCV